MKNKEVSEKCYLNEFCFEREFIVRFNFSWRYRKIRKVCIK